MLTTPKPTLDELRDNLAEKSVNRNMLELHEADARVRHCDALEKIAKERKHFGTCPIIARKALEGK